MQTESSGRIVERSALDIWDSPALTKICRMGWQFCSDLGRRRGEMTNQSIQEEILNQLDKLPVEQQAQVLDFARALTKPEGRQGKEEVRSPAFRRNLDCDDFVSCSVSDGLKDNARRNSA